MRDEDNESAGDKTKPDWLSCCWLDVSSPAGITFVLLLSLLGFVASRSSLSSLAISIVETACLNAEVDCVIVELERESIFDG